LHWRDGEVAWHHGGLFAELLAAQEDESEPETPIFQKITK
jgi:hypothetical protein